MKIVLERPGKAEPDLELIWLLVLAAGGVLGLAWLLSPLPTPACPFHEITGLPCPTCGGTRCVRSLLGGNLAAAFAWNPLVFAGAFLSVGFAAYAAAVFVFRLPRVRLRSISPRGARLFRLGIVGMVVVNWLYLIHHFSRLPTNSA